MAVSMVEEVDGLLIAIILSIIIALTVPVYIMVCSENSDEIITISDKTKVNGEYYILTDDGRKIHIGYGVSASFEFNKFKIGHTYTVTTNTNPIFGNINLVNLNSENGLENEIFM